MVHARAWSGAQVRFLSARSVHTHTPGLHTLRVSETDRSDRWLFHWESGPNTAVSFCYTLALQCVRAAWRNGYCVGFIHRRTLWSKLSSTLCHALAAATSQTLPGRCTVVHAWKYHNGPIPRSIRVHPEPREQGTNKHVRYNMLRRVGQYERSGAVVSVLGS